MDITNNLYACDTLGLFVLLLLVKVAAEVELRIWSFRQHRKDLKNDAHF